MENALENASDITLPDFVYIERPCGADLEYDPAFIALHHAAAGTREQQFGDVLMPAVAPDWRQVEGQATGLLERTTDLRVIALLTRAWTETEGLAGFARGLELAADALDRHWDHVHPRVDADGERDPLPRVNAIAAFTDPRGLGRSARNAILLLRPSGPLSLRDAAMLLETGRLTAGDTLSPAELRALLKAAPEELAVVSPLLDVIERIGRQLAVKLDASWVPDPGAVTAPLRVVYEAAQPSVHEADAASARSTAQRTEPSFAAPARIEQNLSQPGTGAEPPPLPISVRSRADALLALENACAYLEHAEPGHPAPILIRRAQRLMHMSFYDILRDMAPAALPQLDILAGQTERP